MSQRKKDDRPSATARERGGARSVRSRTLRHLEKILKTTTAAGAALGFTACEGGDNGGNIVCDPLPPPLECSGDEPTSSFNMHASWSAEWRDTGSGFVIDVTVRTYTHSDEDTLTFSGDPVVTGASVSDIVREDTNLTFALTPDAGATEASFVIPLTCNGVNEELRLRLSVDGTPTDGGNLPITTDDE